MIQICQITWCKRGSEREQNLTILVSFKVASLLEALVMSGFFFSLFRTMWFGAFTFVLFCALCGVMGGGKDFTEDQIAAITSLNLVGKSNKEISGVRE